MFGFVTESHSIAILKSCVIHVIPIRFRAHMLLFPAVIHNMSCISALICDPCHHNVEQTCYAFIFETVQKISILGNTDILDCDEF